MKKHDRAIEEIMKSKKYIENIEKEVCRQLTDSSTDPVLRKRLE